MQCCSMQSARDAQPGQQCATKLLKLTNVNKNISLLQSVQDPMLTLNHVEPQDSSCVMAHYSVPLYVPGHRRQEIHCSDKCPKTTFSPMYLCDRTPFCQCCQTCDCMSTSAEM
jgi:hypothetical protein